MTCPFPCAWALVRFAVDLPRSIGCYFDPDQRGRGLRRALRIFAQLPEAVEDLHASLKREAANPGRDALIRGQSFAQSVAKASPGRAEFQCLSLNLVADDAASLYPSPTPASASSCGFFRKTGKA